jgi:hypothetical protein
MKARNAAIQNRSRIHEKDNLPMKFNRLFPEKQNEYDGYKIVVILAILLAVISTLRSLVHIFFPDGGAGVIAGIELSGILRGAVIFTFAWAGLYQLIFAILQWIVLLRYRRFLPLMLLLMLFEQASLFIIPLFKPISQTVLSHTPPEAIGNKILLPLMFLLFIFSFVRKPSLSRETK